MNRGAISYDKNGEIVFSADVINAIYNNSVSAEDQIKMMSQLLDPTGRRQRYFEELNQTKANKRINEANPIIAKARKEFEEVTTYNQRLLEKGLDPNNPKDLVQFKKFDQNILLAVLGTFGIKSQ